MVGLVVPLTWIPKNTPRLTLNLICIRQNKQTKKVYLYFQLDTLFSSVYIYSVWVPLSSIYFRPHRPIIRRSKLYMQPVVVSPSAGVFVVWPLRKK
jgi:hypothetical protein